MAAQPAPLPEAIQEASDWPPIPDLRSDSQEMGPRAGELALQLIEPEPVTARQAEQPAGRLERATRRVEAATERQRQALRKELRVGDEALLRAAERSFQYHVGLAVERYDRYNHLATNWGNRADRYHGQGGVWGTIMGCINRGFAGYFGWRARAAQQLKNYYTNGSDYDPNSLLSST